MGVAEEHPEALLPCPLCAAPTKGRNLAEHVARAHDNEVARGPVLRGRGRLGLPRTVELRPDEIRCGRRTAALPAPLLVGRWDTDVTDFPLAQSLPSTSHVERAGAYLQVGSIVVLGKAPGVRSAWTGAAPGPSRKRGHVRLGLPEFQALVWHLAERGDLTPRTTSSQLKGTHAQEL